MLYDQNVYGKLHNLSYKKSNYGGVSDTEIERKEIFQNGSKIKNTNTLRIPKSLLGGVLAKPLLSDFAHKNKAAAKSRQKFCLGFTPSAIPRRLTWSSTRTLGTGPRVEKTLGMRCLDVYQEWPPSWSANLPHLCEYLPQTISFPKKKKKTHLSQSNHYSWNLL